MAGEKRLPALKLFSHARVLSREEDHDLMLRTAQGDTQAFQVLYNRYKTPIRSYIHSLVRTTTVADELAQEVFLRIYRARETYSQSAKFSTWLWTIARNLSFDHLRKKTEWLWDGERESFLEPVDDSPSAETQLILRATRAGIERCLEELSPAQRETVALRAHSELSYEEIAAALGCSLPAVKNHLHRAKAHLADCLQRGGHRE